MPTLGEILQVTAVLVVPVTVAEHWMVRPAGKSTIEGFTVTTIGVAGGVSVIVAVADTAGSATLVAFTNTAVMTMTDDGAV